MIVRFNYFCTQRGHEFKAIGINLPSSSIGVVCYGGSIPVQQWVVTEKSFPRSADPKLRLWVDYESETGKEQLILGTQLNSDA